jgi:hypothetical protein
MHHELLPGVVRRCTKKVDFINLDAQIKILNNKGLPYSLLIYQSILQCLLFIPHVWAIKIPTRRPHSAEQKG